MTWRPRQRVFLDKAADKTVFFFFFFRRKGCSKNPFLQGVHSPEGSSPEEGRDLRDVQDFFGTSSTDVKLPMFGFEG